jgi:hypothetical protein
LYDYSTVLQIIKVGAALETIRRLTFAAVSLKITVLLQSMPIASMNRKAHRIHGA